MTVYEVELDICTLETGLVNYNLPLFSSKENAIKFAKKHVRDEMSMRGYDEEEIRMEIEALEEGKVAVFEDSDGTEYTFYISERKVYEEVIQ